MNHFKLSTVLVSVGMAAAVAAAGISYLKPDSSPDRPFSRQTMPEGLKGKIAELKKQKFDVLITTRDHDYASVIADIENMGGVVSREFKYATGLAASVPVSGLMTLKNNGNVIRIADDQMRYLAGGSNRIGKGERKAFGKRVAMGGAKFADLEQRDAMVRSGAGFDLESVQRLKASSKVTLTSDQVLAAVKDLAPDTYWNPAAMNAAPVWNSGNLGQDTIVAVIDTGVWGGHFLLEDSLVGCEDLSGDDPPDCSSPDNHWHGTHVASTIAGHGGILLAANDPLAKAIAQYASPLPQASSMGYPSAKILPLFGMAPAAQIYGIKVFPQSGAGAPTSTIIAGIERVIELKMVDGVDIDVINMSLGGGTTYDVHDLESQVVDAATDAGITVVTSAGNDGPASQTVGSPAGAHTAIATGAIAEPVHMRVFWDLDFGKPGIGHQLFVSDDPQMVYFSSRGAASDGSFKPAVSSTGAFVLAALPDSEHPQGIGFSSGTSMASPGVAGTVALLNTWSENEGDLATPLDYRQAIEAGAVPIPHFEDYEQGAGFNNAGNALAALASDHSLGDVYPPLGPAPADAPVPPEGTDLGFVGAGSATVRVRNLAPGEVRHFYFETTPDTSRITVDASNPRTSRNPYGLNSFEFNLSTGDRTYEDYYFLSANIWANRGPAHFEVSDRSSTASGNATGINAKSMLIQPGYTRISIENDWTSAGPVSGTFEINAYEEPRPAADYAESGEVGQDELDEIAPLFPCELAQCSANLHWANDWTQYPTSDLDLTAWGVDPTLSYLVYIDFGGGSLHSPETTSIDREDPVWTLGDPNDVGFMFYDVSGYDTHGGVEPYTFEWFEAPSP